MHSPSPDADESAELSWSRRAEEPVSARVADPPAPPFSRFTVRLAFALSPVVGGWLVLAINSSRHGCRVRAVLLLLPILAVAVAIATLALLGPVNKGTIVDSERSLRLFDVLMVFTVVHLGGLTYLLLKMRQRFFAWSFASKFHKTVAFDDDTPEGPTAPAWPAIGIAVLCTVLSLGPAIGALYVSAEVLDERFGQEMVFEDQTKLHFGRSVTAADAARLGVVLHEVGYFHGNRGAAAHVTREQGRVLVSFPVNHGAWHRPEVLAWFRDVRVRMAAQAFPREAVAVRLCDRDWKMQKMLD